MSAYPPNPKLEKTALGSQETVLWWYYKNTMDAVSLLKNINIPVFAAEHTLNSVDYRMVEYPNPIALVLGHELHGVGDLVLDVADKVISIPMRGTKASLNVATAGGILMYEATRNKL